MNLSMLVLTLINLPKAEVLLSGSTIPDRAFEFIRLLILPNYVYDIKDYKGRQSGVDIWKQ